MLSELSSVLESLALAALDLEPVEVFFKVQSPSLIWIYNSPKTFPCESLISPEFSNLQNEN